MENGTVIWKEYGIVYKAQLLYKCDLDKIGFGSLCFKKLAIEQESQHPEPFNDGKYLHYTRFHPQLKDMVGTWGYFYDVFHCVESSIYNQLIGVDCCGYPLNITCNYAYFAVPIKQPKTEITLQEIADKFGVDVEQLRIKE